MPKRELIFLQGEHTARSTVPRTASKVDATRLVKRVPNGSHFRYWFLPIPCPLSLAKSQRAHTPGGPTTHASHRRLRTVEFTSITVRTRAATHRIVLTVKKNRNEIFRRRILSGEGPHLFCQSLRARSLLTDIRPDRTSLAESIPTRSDISDSSIPAMRNKIISN
jgi:hypothetical protein